VIPGPLRRVVRQLRRNLAAFRRSPGGDTKTGFRLRAQLGRRLLELLDNLGRRRMAGVRASPPRTIGDPGRAAGIKVVPARGRDIRGGQSRSGMSEVVVLSGSR